MRFLKCLNVCVLLFSSFAYYIPSQAQYFRKPLRVITTKDGLPQSFVAAMVQDSTGFIWIGTRDGLARYDGKGFKTFRHVFGDTTTLINNTITNLYLDKQSNLWVQYETGDIDILNTITEALFHLTEDPVYKTLHNSGGIGYNIAEDNKGNAWLLGGNGDIFICNINKHTIHVYTEALLHLQHNKIIGITSYHNNILLSTDTALILVNDKVQIARIIPYTFANPHLYNRKTQWRDTYHILNSNKILIHDNNRLIVFNDDTELFMVIPLPEKDKTYFHSTQDRGGQFYFNYDSTVYKLSVDNRIIVYKSKEGSPQFGFASILIDR